MLGFRADCELSLLCPAFEAVGDVAVSIDFGFHRRTILLRDREIVSKNAKRRDPESASGGGWDAPMDQTINDRSIAPEDRFCDLVMKGGITSGVVYPPAICALAKKYRFKNIGGTSAGAIAAAVTAAAEYQPRRDGSMDGFSALEGLPKELGTKGSGGKTQLLRLFQPDRPCLRLFRILTGS